jgi:hypothetical protein
MEITKHARTRYYQRKNGRRGRCWGWRLVDAGLERAAQMAYVSGVYVRSSVTSQGNTSQVLRHEGLDFAFTRDGVDYEAVLVTVMLADDPEDQDDP